MPWYVERIVHFGAAHSWWDGYANFGFHDRCGRLLVLQRDRDLVGMLGCDDQLLWTAAREPAYPGVPNIRAEIEKPHFIDQTREGTYLVSSTGNGRIYRLDLERRVAELWLDAASAGMRDVGNCVVGDDDHVWINEIRGCRVWRFDPDGRPLRTFGDGVPGFQPGVVAADAVRFHWIYDLRKGPDGRIYVLDSRNFAIRVIDPARETVTTVAGTGLPGYDGDGGDAHQATFGSDPVDQFDGPYALSLDEQGNIYVGDTQNHVVRTIDRRTGTISTIAGHPRPASGVRNPLGESDPLRLRFRIIGSMEYWNERLFVPEWDLSAGTSDLIVLWRRPSQR